MNTVLVTHFDRHITYNYSGSQDLISLQRGDPVTRAGYVRFTKNSGAHGTRARYLRFEKKLFMWTNVTQVCVFFRGSFRDIRLLLSSLTSFFASTSLIRSGVGAINSPDQYR